jgi:hypothetical protein
VFVDVYLWPVPAGNVADPWLRDPTVPAVIVTSLPRDDKPPVAVRKQQLPTQQPVVAMALFTDLITRYGPAEGRRVYFEMEAKRQGPFAAGNKYDAAKRHVPRRRGAGHRAPTVHINIPDARKS